MTKEERRCVAMATKLLDEATQRSTGSAMLVDDALQLLDAVLMGNMAEAMASLSQWVEAE